MLHASVLEGRLPVREFLRAFPFFFAWDESGLIVEVGPSLVKVCPQAQPGRRVEHIFELSRPAGELSNAHVLKHRNALFVLEDRFKRRVLRGSMLVLDESRLFVMLVSPWIADPGQLIEFGLTLGDFGAQDQTLDLLSLLQTQHMAAADLRRLNEVLKEQRGRLREQEARSRKLALVAAHTDNAVVVTDAQGRIEWTNEAFTRISGWALDEVMGRRPGEFLQGPATDPNTVRYMSECIRERRSFSVELVNYRRDGSSYWIAIEVQPLLDENGEMMNFMAIERDVTQRKQDQEAISQYQLHLEDLVETRTEELIHNKLLLEAIVKTTPNGLLLVDHRGAICMTNASLENMFGYGADELVGLPLEVLVPTDRRGAHEHLRSAFMVDPKPRPMSDARGLMGQRKDGSRFPIEVALANFSVNKVRFIQATIADITARKAAEDELRDLNANLERKVALRTEELATASAAKSEFLANMSHEIRTPLNGILGLAQLLERDALASDQRDMVFRIRQAGQSLLAIINDILDFSKIEAGQLRIDPRPFELTPMLAQIGSLLGSAAHAKGLELRIEPVLGLGGVLVGDFLRLEQVLMNLVGNAIKFTERGEVALRIDAVEATPDLLRLRFEISDTGIGIPAEQIDRLFRPFTQAEASITRRFGGTGLGLSICKRLVELMGGEIGVSSTLGVGSVFWLELPFGRAVGLPSPQKVDRRQPRSAKDRLSGLNILVVDDSRMNRDVIQRLLLKEGARTTLAADGQQALQYLAMQQEAFDAVLMDMQMPVMDGLAATRAIRMVIGLRELPVIALTAGVLAEQRRQAEEAGCNDFVAKPVDLEELTETILRWTRRAPPTAPAMAEEAIVEASVIPGLNVPEAVAALGGDHNLFIALLGNFVDEFGQADSTLRRHLQLHEFDAATKLLHALAGAAGYIGAAALCRASRELETAAMDGSDHTDEMTQFLAEFGRVRAGIRERLETV